jgi:hypothetical protein
MTESKLSTADFVAAGQVNSRGAAVLENGESVYDAAVVENTGGAQMVREPAPAQTALFPDKECHDFRSRWDEIQIHFVDDPRKAVETADNLVAETMKRLAEVFSEERKNMETQWSRGENVSTEDLRLALQRYRSFFNRLLLI